MLITFLLCVFALLGIALLAYAARGTARPVGSAEELLAAIQPVDIAAFRNLMDADEEEYLRANLNGQDFRKVQRKRMRAAVEYVWCTVHNSAVLLRLGEAAHGSSNPEVVRAGQKLANDALQLRLRSLTALAWLYLRLLTPGGGVCLPSLLARYMEMRDGMVRLVRLQTPSVVSRIEAVL
jgi:hypothetical protein